MLELDCTGLCNALLAVAKIVEGTRLVCVVCCVVVAVRSLFPGIPYSDRFQIGGSLMTKRETLPVSSHVTSLMYPPQYK